MTDVEQPVTQPSGAAPTHVQVVDLGRAAAFPEPPAGEGFEALVASAGSAPALAAAIEPAFAATGLVAVDTTALRPLYDLGMALVATRSTTVDHLVRTPEADHRRPIAERPPGATLERNDGYLVNEVEACAAAVNALAGRVAVARGAPVTASLLFGSAPFELERPAAATVWVIPLNGDVIVRPSGGAPTDVAAGQLLSCAGWPRIHSHPAVGTLLVVEEDFSDRVRRDASLERLAHHPLLRLDAPVDFGARPVQMYGLDGEVDYASVVAQAADEVLAASPPELLRWWWVLTRRLPPLVAQGPDGTVARGRFPAGLGVLGQAETGDAVVVRAGGHAFVVPDAQRDLLVRLVAGEVVRGGSPDEDRTLTELMRVGLAEPVVDDVRPIVPLVSGADDEAGS